MWYSIAFSWLKKIPREIWYLLGIVVVLWFVYHKGQQDVQREWDASVERGREALSRLKERQITITKGVLVQREVVTKEIKVKGDTIVQKVPVYIPVGTPDLPCQFRLLHDAAATNSIPGGPSCSDGDRVSVEEAARTLTQNYTTFHLMLADLNSLRSWVRQQRQAYLDECKKLQHDCNTDSWPK